MSIFDIFGSAKAAPAAAPAQQQQQTQPGNIPASAAPNLQSAATPGTAPNGAVPNTPETQDKSTKSGLDQFADIWNTDPNAQQQGQPLFNVSHDKMMEAARKQNFVGNAATEAQLAAIQAGGPEAVKAMMEVMNAVAQNSYAQSAYATTRLIEGALDKGGYARTADVDTRIKSTAMNNSLRQENPIFAHPAAQPLLQTVQQQMMVKFPNATPAELADMSKQYLESFVQMASAPAQQQQQANAAKGKQQEDWTAYFAQ